MCSGFSLVVLSYLFPVFLLEFDRVFLPFKWMHAME